MSKIGVVYQWNVLQGGKPVEQWTTDLKNGSGKVWRGAADKPGCTLTLEDDDFAQLFAGKLDAMKAFMSGKLKIGGNAMLAQKLQTLFKPASKL